MSPESYHNNFITAVREMMAEMGTTELKDAATLLQIPKATLYRIMRRKSRPKVEHGQVLCAVFRCTADWLFLNRALNVEILPCSPEVVGKAESTAVIRFHPFSRR